MRLPFARAAGALVAALVAAASAVQINAGGAALGGYAKDSTLSATRRPFFKKGGSGPTTVYDSHSWAPGGGDLVYRIPVAAGAYTVRLQFAENFSGAGKPGARLLNVNINAARVATGLDVYVAAGNKLYAPYDIVTNNVSPQNGNIVIRVSPTRQNALLSGIVVTRKGAAPPAPRARAPVAAAPVAALRVAAPAPAPPTVSTSGGLGAWSMVTPSSGLPTRRHEACSLMVDGKVYLIGGRGRKPVNVFDPATGAWTARRMAPIELHHMQCAAYKNRFVYIAGAWTGGFPRERTVDVTYVYDVRGDSWRTEPGLGARARGGGAFAFYNGKGYLAMGNRGGHGAHATTLGEFDVYDPVKKTWARLPNAPDARDHVGGGIVGNRFCIAGGRDGGTGQFWRTPIAPVNCFNFGSGRWERRANLPEGRAGAATGTICGGLLMVAGGEGIPPGKAGKAFDRVDFYDVASNTFRTPVFLKRGRHGSGLAISPCDCGNIYLASGSGGLGGNPELTSTEVWHITGSPRGGC